MSESTSLIANRFSVLLGQPLPEAGGGLPAFAATDRQAGGAVLIAIQVARDRPARAQALQSLTAPIEGMLCPLAHGPAPAPHGETGYFVICTAPPGAPVVADLRPWPESELVAFALRPIARVLDRLAALGLTHRAIRPDNVFQGQRGRPLVLGAAWAAPPAMHQPALFDPPYSAMCHPAGRGDGHIADDIYALGVLILTLAIGRIPLAGMDDATILHRKLEHGSYAALAGDTHLPPLIADLIRGMLAEDPEHRPRPDLLLDPGVARSRRVAARPPRRAQRSLLVGTTAVWDARSLAYVMAREPELGVTALRSGAALQWLRRDLGDAALAGRLEELHRHRLSDRLEEDSRADAMMLMRTISVIDPLMPLCWRGLVLWPDGLGPLLVRALADETLAARIAELVAVEAAANWGALRPERCDIAMLRMDVRQQRVWLTMRAPAGGLMRLAYALNPLLPCDGALLGKRWVTQLSDVPAGIEAALAADPKIGIIDAHLVAFVAARGDSRLEAEASALTSVEPGLSLPGLRLLAQLQLRYHEAPLPTLAARAAQASEPIIALWHNRQRQQSLGESLRTLARAGMLIPMLALLEDPVGRTADALGARQAAARLKMIDAELAAIDAAGPGRSDLANRIGQEIVAGIGLTLLAAMLILTVLG